MNIRRALHPLIAAIWAASAARLTRLKPRTKTPNTPQQLTISDLGQLNNPARNAARRAKRKVGKRQYRRDTVRSYALKVACE